MTTRALVSLCLVCTLVGAVGGGVGGELVWGWRQSKDIAKAEAKHEEQNALSKQAGEHAAAAEALESTVADLKAALARINASKGGGKPAGPAVAVPVAALPAVDDLKDQIIAAQDKQIAELKAESADLRDALKAADARAENLQGAIKHAPKSYKHALGAVYTSDGGRGVAYEYSLGRLRVGADVVLSRPGANRSVQGAVRVLWSF